MRMDGRLSMRKEAVQRRSRETVGVILQAAAQVFSARGYARCTTNHIAERAGISVGSLYQYFPNKDAILLSLMEGHLRQARQMLDDFRAEAESSAEQPRALLEKAVRMILSLHGDDPALHRILLEQAPQEGPLVGVLRDIEESAVDLVETIISGVPGGPAPNPRLRAQIVVYIIEDITHRFLTGGKDRPGIDQLTDEIVRLVGAYLFDASTRINVRSGE